MSEETEFIIMVAVYSAVVALLVIRLIDVIRQIMRYRKQRKEYPALEKAESICKSPHTWNKVKVAMREIPIETYNVCEICGYIAGTDYKLNKPGMIVYENERKLIAAEKQYVKTYKKLLEEDFEKLRMVYKGMFTLQEEHNYRTLKMFSDDVMDNVMTLRDRTSKELKKDG